MTSKTIRNLHWLSLLAAGIYLAFLNASQWFWADDFFLIGSLHDPASSILSAGSYHPQVLSAAIHVVLYAIFGFRTYLPYMLVLIAFHLAVGHLLWRMMIRAQVPPVLATVSVLAFLLMGAGFGTLLWSQLLTEPIAICFGLLLLEIDDTEVLTRNRNMSAYLISAVAVLSFEAGLLLVVCSAIVAGLRRGRGAAIRRAVPPLVIYLLWLLLFAEGSFDNLGRAQSNELAQLPDFLWSGLVGATDAYVAAPILGAIALVAALAWAASRMRSLSRPGFAPVIMCGASALGLMVLIGAGRLNGGIPWTSYYVYPLAALLLPLLVLGLSSLTSHLRVGQVAIPVALAGISAINGTAVLTHEAASWAPLRESTRDSVELAASTTDPLALPYATVDPVGSLGMELINVREGESEGTMPTPQSFSDASKERETARLHAEFTTAALPSLPFQSSPAAVIQLDGVGSPAQTLSSCRTFTPGPGGVRIKITTSGGSALRISSDTATYLAVALQYRSGGVEEQPGLGVSDRVTGHLAISSSDVAVILEASNDLTLCPGS